MADHRNRVSGPRPPAEAVRDAETENERAESLARSVLERRGVVLHDDDSGDGLARILSSIERFDEAVARRGGDSFTNDPRSSDPERDEFVIPRRAADESAELYARRVTRLAERLAPGAP